MDAPYRHIACCVDLSPATEAGVAEAARLRAVGPGRLTLIHVFRYPTLYGSPWEPDMGGLLESAERWLAARAAAAPGAETVMLEGIPGEEAVAWAEAHGVDLIVAATHHAAARRAVLGSFAHHLLHHAPCPVLVVRGRDEEGTPA